MGHISYYIFVATKLES
ncbi:692cc898-c287-4bab-b9cb-5bc58a97ffc8 [Thermothielavioides terrestris]|uniref:692cc898-c287-4bab-b9cb-5bc58a97ffc8 n=1 Tax=Thermothielavioides terrestris TaxID=2587410 RepID=A0A3S4D2G0_9PEZI|nr:692cc898-c287-4bab-b9cb-5bc58a97ffc8 [Thermothielavioides terrestris]